MGENADSPPNILEHSVDGAVPVAFAWAKRTDVSSWSDPPATFALDGPFEPGSWGTTSMRVPRPCIGAYVR